MHKVTWIHSRSKHGHILDYIITRKRDLRDVCSVRVMRRGKAEGGTDHKLVLGKLKMCIKRKVNENNWDERQVPKHIDVSKLEIHKYVKLSEIRFTDNIDAGGPWEQF